MLKTKHCVHNFVYSEGQKKAYIGEWTQLVKQNVDIVSDLKKEIKDLTGKVTCLGHIDTHIKVTNKEPQEVLHKTSYPPGAKSAEDAVRICDLKVINELCNRMSIKYFLFIY